MTEFFQTVMGRSFYEGTMPKVARALERIASAVEQRTAGDDDTTERPWIVARGTMVGVQCERCKYQMLIPLPVSIDFLVATSRALAHDHRNCTEAAP
jgi:hypothetical protein